MEANILIVDDSAIMVETLTSILSSQGWHVESCDDGESGWRRLLAAADGSAAKPDLLLLDLNMPGTDGLTLLGRIRANDRLACLPVLIITAQTDSATRLRAMETGANGYLSKPVDLSELLARVRGFSA